jgi:hypothetical protein
MSQARSQLYGRITVRDKPLDPDPADQPTWAM